ncbi:hypothetical protein J1605_013784 [Eschrichtius robustus]|uniref:Pro-cathepsin H n=1 Tax=Eschrichtius robustus TaxID=9764 RepID=A0AB34GHS4_ESCRO|nr:hypothetical protein J1605_013784 [Eschrichtius robustus]
MVPASPDRPADLGPRRTERSNSPLPFLAEKGSDVARTGGRRRSTPTSLALGAVLQGPASSTPPPRPPPTPASSTPASRLPPPASPPPPPRPPPGPAPRALPPPRGGFWLPARGLWSQCAARVAAAATATMWAVLPLLCAGAWLLGPTACGAADLAVSSLEMFHFKSWMVQHRKTYSSEEYHHRLQAFVSNWRKINAHNAGNHTFKMGLNQFSDMSFAELKRKYLWSEPQNCSATKGNYLRGTGPYPPSMDWRKKGNFVSPVKNQGSCGSCWTFSTTGALESAVAIATGRLPSLAEQQLVDCAQNFNNHGCQGYGPDRGGPKPLLISRGHFCRASYGLGTATASALGGSKIGPACGGGRGLPSQAFEYIRYNKGIMGEDTYPYKGQDGDCKFQPSKAIAFVKDVANITMNDEEAMVEAVALYNPVSFAFEVIDDFLMYKKGVYSSTSCHKTPDKVNHAVLAVGYGEENGIPYWIVKNSWGPQWGMKGYFLMERGKNMCGLAACASYPIPLV